MANDLSKNELKSEDCEDTDIQLLYEYNFMSQGLGAIVIYSPGQWQFKPLSQSPTLPLMVR